MKSYFLIFHYGEIATKSGNRLFFEKTLVANISRLLESVGVHSVRNVYGGIVARCDDTLDVELLRSRLRFLFGLENVRLATRIEPNIEAITASAIDAVANADGSTFKIDTRRSDKSFPMDSMQVNANVGEAVLEKTGMKVDVHTPDITCVIELGAKDAYVSVMRLDGPGGLPVGSQSPLIAMLSGGIDSPVAALRMMRRGAPVAGIHFQSYPFTTRASLDKVKELAQILAVPQGGMEVAFIPFADIQKATVQHAPPELRVILYRRSMFRITAAFAVASGRQGIVTGESLGQVASQTVENIVAISEAVHIPVFRPLIGMNKNEIMNEAREFGTYGISIRPHDDCCSLFLPDHPETRARLETVLAAERSIPGLFELEAKALASVDRWKT